MSDAANASQLCAANERRRLLTRALVLVSLSIGWGVVSGGWTIAAAAGAHSLGVLGLGLSVCADVMGSIAVAWRLWAEQRGGEDVAGAERTAGRIVGVALGAIAVFLLVEAIRRIVSGGSVHPSVNSLAATGISTIVLAALGLSKRRTGSLLGSDSLRGDGTISLVGATTAAVALVGLLVDHWGWWWADPIAALLVASAALTGSVKLLRHPARRGS